MRKAFIPSLPITAVMCLVCVCSGANPVSEVAFEIPDKELVPEGIAFDAETGRFFVGSTYKRKIVEIDRTGHSKDFVGPATDGLLGVLGMRVDAMRRMLWAVSAHAGSGMPIQNAEDAPAGTSRLHQYDVDTGKLLRRYQIGPGDAGSFLNDMTIANSGDVYITDSERNRIYRVRLGSDAVQLFYQLDDTMPPNGIDISADQRYLYVAVYGGHNVVRLSLEDRILAQVSLPDGEEIFADGLYVYGKSLIAIQPWSNDRIIAQYHLDSSGTSVNDVSVLDNDSPHFLQPTTAVIVGESLYCIANSQLQLFRKMHSGEETVSELRHPLVLRVRLGNEVESH